MRNYKVKICEKCGKKYVPTGNHQKYCIDCGKEQIKQYNLEHSERRNECSKQYYLDHCEQRKQQKRQWEKEHPEREKETDLRHFNKRKRNLDFIPLNKCFEDSVAHHIDLKHVIYIPEELHKSIYHDLIRGTNMHIINGLAVEYLLNQGGKGEFTRHDH